MVTVTGVSELEAELYAAGELAAEVEDYAGGFGVGEFGGGEFDGEVGAFAGG